MGVVSIKNPSDVVISEIGGWLKNHGYYCRHIFVVDHVYMFVSSKISDGDCREFEDKFGKKIYLEGANFDGDGEKMEFEYFCDHKLLADFRQYLHSWLVNQGFPFKYVMVTKNFSLNTDEKLSKTQIQKIEDEFGVEYEGYSLKCNSKDIEYNFSWK